MLKSLLTGLAAVAVIGAGLAVAQPGPRGDAPRHRPTAEDRAALADARIAGLKAGLKLTAEQEKHWPAFESALRAIDKARAERIAARQERRDGARERPDAIARLRRGADAMTARAAALKQLADAAEPLYRSLDDGQKRRFALLMRTHRGPHFGPGHHHWRRRADLAR